QIVGRRADRRDSVLVEQAVHRELVGAAEIDHEGGRVRIGLDGAAAGQRIAGATLAGQRQRRGAVVARGGRERGAGDGQVAVRGTIGGGADRGTGGVEHEVCDGDSVYAGNP